MAVILIWRALIKDRQFQQFNFFLQEVVLRFLLSRTRTRTRTQTQTPFSLHLRFFKKFLFFQIIKRTVSKMKKKLLSFAILFMFLLVSGDGAAPMGGPSMDSPSEVHGLRYNNYMESCDQAEKLVWSSVGRTTVEHERAPAQLLRLLFHDCFIQGCDASVMLDDSRGVANHSIERNAIPNRTLKGFDYVEGIKRQLEKECPGVVSCSDILVIAARDAMVLSGGPYYPVLTGRRDSVRSYFSEALAEIPRPDGNISETLRLFASRGFNEREVVALLGGHNIGKIGCQFIQPRLNMTDPGIPLDFSVDMRRKCRDANASISSAPASGDGFDSHYYQTVLRGKALLKADQELMANEETAKVVLEYAEDADRFRVDFASAMIKLSNLNVLVRSGEVRRNCSALNSSSDLHKDTASRL